jgi:hypothetical protein
MMAEINAPTPNALYPFYYSTVQFFCTADSYVAAQKVPYYGIQRFIHVITKACY